MSETQAVKPVTPARPHYFGWAATLIVLVGFGLRFWQLGAASVWDDESISKMHVEVPLNEFVDNIHTSDTSQVPLYFVLLHLFPTDTAFGLRVLSAVAGTVGIALLIVVTVRLYSNYRLALIAGALLAVNPYHMLLSRMARPYALLFVLMLLASYFFLVLLRGERSRKNWLGFVLSSMAAYMTHYYAAALPLAQYILFAFVLRRKRRFFRQWIVVQTIASIPTLIWIVVLLRREVISLVIDWLETPVLSDLFFTIWNLTVGYDGDIAWYEVLGLIAALAGLLTGLYYAFRERRTNQENFYWFWMLVASLCLAFVISITLQPIYLDRYFMALLPALVLLLAGGLMRLPKRVALPVLALVAVAELSNTLITLSEGTYERQAWCDAADYVEQGYGDQDGLVVSSQVALLSLFNCYDSREMLDRTILFDLPDAGPDGAPVRAQWERPVTRLWAVYSNPDENLHNERVIKNHDPFEINNSRMSDWLIRRRAQIISRRDFKGVSVFLVDVQNDVYNSDEFGR